MKKALTALALGLFLVTACVGCGDAGNGNNAEQAVRKNRSSEPEKEEVYVELTNPIVETLLDGEIVYFAWNSVENATGYEFEFEGEVYSLEYPYFIITNVEQGTSVAGKIRALCETEDKVFYSDWVEKQQDVPLLEYTNLKEGALALLSAKQAVEWANAYGYECDVTQQEDNTTVVKIHYKDEENSGFFNSGKRVLSAAWDGFWGGYDETIQDDFSSLEEVLAGTVVSGGVKNFLTDESQSATENGEKSALIAAVNAAFLDSDIYYVAVYANPSQTPLNVIAYKLQNNRENLPKDYENIDVDPYGRYILHSNTFNRDVYVNITEVTQDGYKKWAIVYTK